MIVGLRTEFRGIARVGAENHGNANIQWNWGKLAFLTADFFFFFEKNGIYILCEPSGWILHVCMFISTP